MKPEIDSLRGTYYIYFNGRYVVLAGPKLCIFHPDGSMVACRKDLRYATRISFLSENRMLLSCKSIIHMIALQNGEDLWTVPLPQKDISTAPFVFTPDESCAYSFVDWDSCLYIIRLDLKQQEIDTYGVAYDSGATWDIICDEEGIPCVLKSGYENIAGKDVHQNGVRIQDYDILYRGSSCYWKSKWQFDGCRFAKHFLGSTDRVVTNDLCIYVPSSGAEINLLEKSPGWQPPENSPTVYWTDTTGRYLCLSYSSGNVVIDIQERRVVAQYPGACVQGCIVGEEYWICEEKKIARKPFPAMKPLPEEKPSLFYAVGAADEYFSKHPELW